MSQFLPDNTLPRLTQSPYDDPQVFDATWDETMSDIEQANGSAGGSTDLIAAFLKTGRMSAIAPTLPLSPALGINLPDGFQWVQDGELITVSGDTFVGDVPQNFDGWASLVATYNPGVEDWEFALTTSETKPAPGSGILAKVVSDVSTVTEITTSTAESDIVLTMPEIVAALGAGGSGGGGSGYIGDGSWLITDPRAASVVILELLAANLQTALTAIANGGIIPSTAETDTLWAWLLNTRNIQGKATPSLLEYSLGSGAEPQLHGTESAPETEGFDVGGTLDEGDREYDSR